MEAPLEDQAHQEGLRRVLRVVGQRQLVAAQLLRPLAQNGTPHLGAQGAGMLVLSDVKESFVDVRVFDVDGHAHLGGIGFQRGGIRFFLAGGQGNGLQGEISVAHVAVIQAQGLEQQHPVLAAADADGDPVAGGESMVFLIAPANLS